MDNCIYLYSDIYQIWLDCDTRHFYFYRSNILTIKAYFVFDRLCNQFIINNLFFNNIAIDDDIFTNDNHHYIGLLNDYEKSNDGLSIYINDIKYCIDITDNKQIELLTELLKVI